MGNCAGNASPDSNDSSAERSREIEQQLRKDAKKTRTKKILLLGTGDAGKSTFFRQLQIISGTTQFGSQLEQRDLIAHNVLVAIQSTIIGSETLGVPLSAENEQHAQTIRGLAPDTSHKNFLTYLTGIQALLSDPGFQQVAERAHLANLPSSLPYWLANLERIADADYNPSLDDLLRSRSKTSGITEYIFEQGSKHFSVVDVGGQRSERRKWIHCFDAVDCLLFFTAISEYDQFLEEDSKVNRMHESLRLFREIINSQWFVETPIVLMLNKRDLFEAKIRTRDLRCCFPEYTDGCDADKASSYIRRQFLDTNRGDRPIYTHLTCATDTEQMRVIFGAIVAKALADSLQAGGL